MISIYLEIHPIKQTVQKTLKYVCSENKTNEYTNDKEIIAEAQTWEDIRTGKNKNSGILAFHVIISPDPRLKIPGEQINEMANQFAEQMFGKKGFEYICKTHYDTDIIHSHIVFNAVSTETGMKYYDTPETVYQLRACILKIYKEHGYEESFNRNQEKERFNLEAAMNKYNIRQETNRETVKRDINYCISVSNNFESFLSNMKSIGYDVKYKNSKGDDLKYISFKPCGSSRYIRSRTLGSQYSIGAIRERINLLNQKKNEKTAYSYRTNRSVTDTMLFKSKYRKRIKYISEKWKAYYSLDGKIRYRRLNEIESFFAKLINRKRKQNAELLGSHSKKYVNRMVEEINQMTYGFKYLQEHYIRTAEDLRKRFIFLTEKRKQLNDKVEFFSNYINDMYDTGTMYIYNYYDQFTRTGDKEAEEYLKNLNLPQDELRNLYDNCKNIIDSVESIKRQIEVYDKELDELNYLMEQTERLELSTEEKSVQNEQVLENKKMIRDNDQKLDMNLKGEHDYDI